MGSAFSQSGEFANSICMFLRHLVPNGVDPLAWLTDVLERMVSGQTKVHELERLLPWTWKAEQLATVVNT